MMGRDYRWPWCEDNNAMLATSNYNQSDRLVHHFLFAFMGKKRNCHLPA
jgi:hypothetical protein